MKMVKLVMIGMLLWGSQAFAELSSGGDSLESALVKIQSKAERLNVEFWDLRLQPRINIPNREIAEKTLQDLNDLDRVLHDDSIVPASTLVNLACSKAYCHGE